MEAEEETTTETTYTNIHICQMLSFKGTLYTGINSNAEST